MKVEVLNISGEKSGKSVTLPENYFGVEPNEHAIYLTIKHYLANQRQGTHKTKEKSEVSGSTRKLHKQKGTGGARKGSIKNPMFRGGARVFGPRPRDYDFKLNAKVKDLAKRSVLSVKAKENNVMVLEDFTMEGRTKEYFNMLKNLGMNNKKTLLILNEAEASILRAGRNIPNARITTAGNLNTYELMNVNQLLFVESALKTLSNN